MVLTKTEGNGGSPGPALGPSPGGNVTATLTSIGIISIECL